MGVVNLVRHARSRSRTMAVRKGTAETVALITRWVEECKEGYRPGDQLPTYDELAELIPATRSTVMRAMQQLRAAGLVIGLRGGGVWVAERDTH